MCDVVVCRPDQPNGRKEGKEDGSQEEMKDRLGKTEAEDEMTMTAQGKEGLIWRLAGDDD